MPRSYRSIILAAVGWLILVAAVSPNNGNQTERHQTADSIKSSLESIARSQSQVTEQAKASEYQTPCRDGEYNNKSELCAEWYSARASRDAADWAFWALVIGIVGAIGIVFALILTIDSNGIARRTARLQLRAYVGVESAGIIFFKPTGGDAANRRIEIRIKNFGQTPALIKDISLGVVKMGDPTKRPNAEPKSALSTVTLNPTHSTTVVMEFEINPTEDQKLEYSMLFIVVHGEICFTDIFGDRDPIRFNYITSGTSYTNRQLRDHRPNEGAPTE
jgi:hypothetical protein